MTNKEIELLLLDLSYRLPHGVKFHYFSEFADGEDPEFDNTITVIDIADWQILDEDHKEWIRVRQIMPYLRPMSSMTEEEARTIFEISGYKSKDILQIKITDDYLEAEIDDGFCSFELHFIWYNEIVNSIQILDFLVSNHFDYRGLIPMGLALEAPEDMYKTK